MDWLKEWVRGLVLLVLLASCLELLLPMNSMKKYVRMVMGLLVVLAVTQPILTFLGQPATVDADRLLPQEGTSLPTMAEIMKQADAFRDRNQALASAQAGERLEAEAVYAARQLRGVAGAKAKVVLEADADQGAQIRQVTVTVQPGLAGAMAPVEPVKPVEPVRAGGAPEAAAKPPEVRAPTEAERQLADAVRRAVMTRLDLSDPAVVTVLVEAGLDSQRR